MKTLGRILGGMMIAEGALVAASPHRYIHFWTSESMPAWMRKLWGPWANLPEGSLRLMAAGEALLGGMMLTLAERTE